MEENISHQNQIKECWQRSLSILRAEIGEATFKSWFRNIQFGEFKNEFFKFKDNSFQLKQSFLHF